MLNVGIVGCGSWSKIIIKEINNNKRFKLTSIVCRNKENEQKKIKNFNSIKNMIDSNINDCIYVAALPYVNLEIVKLVKKLKIPLILEKPISNSKNNIEKLKKITRENNLIIYPNLTNYYSNTFKHLKNYLDANYLEIRRVIIYEGNFGPFRENIHPIWDWGFHPISLLYLLFENKRFTNISKKEIKSSNIRGNGIVTKFSFNINKKISVNIVTGNLFKNKLRKIKIILNNKDYIESDMLQHKVKINSNVKYKGSETPITNLLNKFQSSIFLKHNEESKKLINISSKTINFLEKFYKC
tara:strand:+ start:3432 stop:4325 length:894 start_codon:yes stop_codon:yes gene_type:complete